MRKALKTMGALLVVLIILICIASPDLLSEFAERILRLPEDVLPHPTEAVQPPLEDLDGLYPVKRVVDGDTIIVQIDGEDYRVRMIGVDTPESVHPDAEKNTQEGLDASAWTKDLLTGQSVYLEYDVDRWDDYDRLLAYVYLSDGTTMVNKLLLENGMARTMTIQPNSKYADSFAKIQSEARKKGVGFWAENVF